MTAPYNLTNVSNANNIVDLLISANTNLADSTFGVLLLITVWVILFFNFKNFDARVSIAASSWITAVLAVIISVLGLIDTWSLLVFVVGAAASLIWVIFAERG